MRVQGEKTELKIKHRKEQINFAQDKPHGDMD